MKNGYTPKEFAHSIAVDALNRAIVERYNDPDDVTPSDNRKVIAQLRKLRDRLADEAKLDFSEPMVNT